VDGVHPNIRSSPGTKLDLTRMWNYLRKEGYTNFGTWEGPSSSGGRKDLQMGYVDALQAPTGAEFLAKIKAADPRSFVNNYERLEYFVEKHYAAVRPPYQPDFTDFIRVPYELKEWRTVELPKRDRPQTLVIWGPTRTGKTSWARSLGRHSYLGFGWSLKSVDQDCDYIVIDDIDMSHFKLWQPFLGK